MDEIKSGGEAKIRVAIRDHIPFTKSSLFPNSTKIPPQTLNPPPSHIKRFH